MQSALINVKPLGTGVNFKTSYFKQAKTTSMFSGPKSAIFHFDKWLVVFDVSASCVLFSFDHGPFQDCRHVTCMD